MTKLLTVNQAKDILQISQSCMYKLIQSGKVKSAALCTGKQGKRSCIRIDEADLYAYVQSLKEEAPNIK